MADATTPNLTVQAAGPTSYTSAAQTGDTASMVSSAYENLFGRAPDVGGFQYWTQNLAGQSQSQINQALLGAAASETNAGAAGSDFAAYQASLNKQPTAPAPAAPAATNAVPATSSLSTYDPYSQYRGQAATQLNQLVNNPAQAMSQGGYQAQLQQGVTASQRAAAATGQLQSGGEQNAISNLAQGQFSTYYNNLFNQLSTLSGASQAPASATAAQNASQVSSYLAPYQGQSLASGAALQQTQANVAGYMAPYTAAQTQAQTTYIGGAQTQLAQAQAQANAAQARATGAKSAIDTVSGVSNIIGDVVGSIVSLF